MDFDFAKKDFQNIYSILSGFNFKSALKDRYELGRWSEDLNDKGIDIYYSSDYSDKIELNLDGGTIYVSYGASKCVIVSEDWVYKIPFTDVRFNYCKMEAEIYEKAVEEGLDKFFAPCYFLEKYDGLDVYVMQRADVSYDRLASDLHQHLSSEGRSDEEVEEIIYVADDNSEFVEYLFPYYASEDDYNSLIDFLSDEGVNDLHSGNIGYIDGNVVLIDYSGYRGQLKFFKNPQVYNLRLFCSGATGR